MYFRKRLFSKQKIKLLKNYIVKQITYFYSFLIFFISYVFGGLKLVLIFKVLFYLRDLNDGLI